MKRLVGVMLGLTIAASACGGGKTVASNETPTPSESTPSSIDTGGLTAGKCREAALAMAAAGAGFGNSSSGKTFADIAAADAVALRAMEGVAPANLRADFRLMADAFAAISVKLKGVDYDPSSGKAPPQKFIDAMQAFSAKGFSEASQRVSAWMRTNCQ